METILITGASSGIGMEFAKRYAKDYGEDARLVLVARREEVLRYLGETLQKEYGTKYMVIPVDLSEEYAANKVDDYLKKEKVGIDILVNNAGFATKGLLHKTDYEKQHQEMKVNMIALTELTHLLIGRMAERKRGTVINIASAASFNPVPYSSVYAATKAYVLAFSQGIAYEYANYGVKVIAVCPQATDTHFFDDIEKMRGKMRESSDVVNTTFRGMKKNATIVSDGVYAKIQQRMHHFMSHKFRVRITGKVGKKIWGNSDGSY